MMIVMPLFSIVVSSSTNEAKVATIFEGVTGKTRGPLKGR